MSLTFEKLQKDLGEIVEKELGAVANKTEQKGRKIQGRAQKI